MKYSVYFGDLGNGFKYYYGKKKDIDNISANDFNSGNTTYYFESKENMLSHIKTIAESNLIHNSVATI